MKRRYSRIRFHLFDIIPLIYAAAVGALLIFFHKSVSWWPLIVGIHFALFAGVLELLRLCESHPSSRPLRALRYFYLLPVMLFFWEELEHIIFMFFDSYWFSDFLVGLEKSIFGVHPTVWVQQLHRPGISELMHFFYTVYFLLFLLVPLTLHISRKRRALLAVLSLMTLLYLSCFFLFLLIPAVGPNRIPGLAAVPLGGFQGSLFAGLNRSIQGSRGVAAGALPSSHVAGSLVWVLLSIRYSRKLGLFLIPLPIGIALASVYLGLHHALDPVFGILWGTFCYFMGLKILKRISADPLA